MPRGTASCWTCRIRHKKCDESLPVCNVCAGLEITCYSGQEPPDWMDGGARQQAMAEQLKTEVRNGAKRRRARRILRRIVGDAHEIGPGSLFSLEAPSSRPPLPPEKESDTDMQDTSQGVGSLQLATRLRAACPSDSKSSPASDHPLEPPAETPPTLPKLPTEQEQMYIMAYLDYIFPAVFPFYKPRPLECGRCWVLVLTLANKSLCHAATSLTSFFLSVVPYQDRPERSLCYKEVEDELQKQTFIAMRKAQYDLKEVSIQGVHGDLIATARLLDSIVHLLCLEVSLASNENWKMHLDAGILLLTQIIDHPDNTEGHLSRWTAVLERMRRLAFPGMPKPPSFPSWTIDQAGCRFFVANLIFYDIISSTSLEQAPRLKHFYPDLLADDTDPKEDPDRNCRLRLEDYVGCQNWAMTLVGDIAGLDGWKKNMQKLGALSNMELVRRGADIEQKLRDGLARMESVDVTPQDHRPPWMADSIHAQIEADACQLVTRIWAHAALIYLHVVLSGWQPANREMCDSVAQVLELCKTLGAPTRIHTLAWPLCVAGCLAKPQQEPLFRKIFAIMGHLGMFGSTRLANEIVENIWQMRDGCAADAWDLAACLNSLGRHVLLG